jgi:hypothetical protein
VRFVSKLSVEQWADARRLRAEGADFTSIGKAFGLSRDAIAKRARRDGWEAPAAPPRRASRTNARDAAPLPNDILQARRALSRRILRILDLDLRIMEHRMQKRLNAADQQAEPAGMSDDEVKRLGTFNKTIQDHTEHAPDTDRAVRGAANSAAASAAAAALASEADVFRRELAERIAKLIPPS